MESTQREGIERRGYVRANRTTAGRRVQRNPEANLQAEVERQRQEMAEVRLEEAAEKVEREFQLQCSGS